MENKNEEKSSCLSFIMDQAGIRLQSRNLQDGDEFVACGLLIGVIMEEYHISQAEAFKALAPYIVKAEEIHKENVVLN